MGNYNSYIYNSEEPIPQTMDISDTESEDTLVINKSYSDSTLEVMSESQREKIVKAVGELDVNNKMKNKLLLKISKIVICNFFLFILN